MSSLRFPGGKRLSTDARLAAAKLRVGWVAAGWHRRRLHAVTFIGVTGSAGKTTTKEAIATVLGHSARVRRSPADANDTSVLAKTILRTTNRDRFCVIEIAAGSRPGVVAHNARLLRPHIAVVTNVGMDHRAVFRTLEGTAIEKRGLLDAVVSGGTAVLNADDPLVMGMADGFTGRVVTYGRSPTAELQAEHVFAAWPEPLSFTLRCRGQTIDIRTRLFGSHWVTGALAALAVVHACELPLERAADALAHLAPAPSRMQPIKLGGVSFINDAIKAPYWTLETVLDFLAQARARRKLLVIGTLSDYRGAAETAYRRAADRGLEVADEVLFVGRAARHARHARSARAPEALQMFSSVEPAAEYLWDRVRPGDLVVLKGSARADALEQVLERWLAAERA